MDITVDQKNTYHVVVGADTRIKCHECKHGRCYHDFSTIQIRCSGHTVSATVPSKRCAICRASRIGAADLSFVELLAVAELLVRGVRGPEILVDSKSILGLIRIDLANALKMQRYHLNAVLCGESEPTPKQWNKVVELVKNCVYRYLQFRQPIPLRVTKHRAKK